MINNTFQRIAFESVAKALPFSIDPAKITVEAGLSYTISPVKAHDFAAGIMAAFGSVVERIGVLRGLPAQTMKLNRRRCGLLLNSGQLQFLNGYGCLMDTWPIGPDNGTYRAKDGRHVTVIGLHPHLRDALLEYFQCPNSARALQAAIEKKPAQQIEDEMAALRLPAGIVRSPDEWLAHPQGAATAKLPMIDISQRGNAGNRRLGNARHRPLEGVKVVELAHLVAGPTVGRLLAEQGAEVIKVQPPIGDWVLPLWLDVNWGKKSILLDIKSGRGKARLIELLSGADVLVNSNSPGALERLGLDEAALRQINPGLIYAGASYASASTPWHDRKGFEQIGQAVSGLMHANSEGMTAPTLISVLINDYMTGYLAAIGAIAALAEREERGGYWNVSASLTRCAAMAVTLVEPRNAEAYAPVSVQDMIDHGVDQVTPLGTFTRLASAVEFSHTPSMATLPTGIPGSHPDTTTWSEVTGAGASDDLPHYPSRVARLGGIRNLVPGHGIEDRGDGGGGLSLASKQLFEIIAASRA
ncbi:CoA transferase [Bradyrhizobium sp. dw_411]|uniref:CoA transferase n=1 Tax=Bradyrhizobium sp. dw_411 TaxID=2720082 RepID=UPI001BD0F260|nr:CoA transferase [Bradyrhizobium sp. dw_411]